jgi:hypothetical protein
VANSDNVLVPQSGTIISLGTVGVATPPTSFNSALTGFTDIGYVSDDAPAISTEKDVTEIRDWLGTLVRSVSASTTRTIAIPFLETTPEALRLAFGGGTFTGAGGGVKFVPGDTDQERAIVIHMVDGTKVFRLYIARAIVSEVGEVTPSAEDGTVWQITFTVAEPTSGDAIAIFSNVADLMAASA